jgi:hypothetical protein
LASVLPHLLILVGVVAAWAAFALDRSHAVTRIVPLEIRGVGDQVTVDLPRQTTVAVELRSSRRELELLPADAVEVYAELPNNKLGLHTCRVQVRAPASIEIARYTPESVQIVVRPRGAAAKPSAGTGDAHK